MTEPLNLRNALFDALDDAKKTLRRLEEEWNAKKCESERIYRIALAKEYLRLRAAGVTWSACPDMARGEESVAELRFQRDLTANSYDIAIERINLDKIEIKVRENEYRTERSGG